MKLLEKIAKAKKDIANLNLKKEGKNKFANYDYYTPGQVELMVQLVSDSNRFLTKFDLKRNEIGETGFLTIFDLDTPDFLIYEMATAIPEIKATNIAQQLGGCVTYTERYLKMSAFGITDSNLDLDTKLPTEKVLQPFTESHFEKAKTANATIEQIAKKYSVTPEMKTKYEHFTKV